MLFFFFFEIRGGNFMDETKKNGDENMVTEGLYAVFVVFISEEYDCR